MLNVDKNQMSLNALLKPGSVFKHAIIIPSSWYENKVDLFSPLMMDAK